MGCVWPRPRMPRLKSSNCSPSSTIPAAKAMDTMTATGNVVLNLPPSFATCSTFPMLISSFYTKPVRPILMV